MLVVRYNLAALKGDQEEMSSRASAASVAADGQESL
jgi:hypothetical protein